MSDTKLDLTELAKQDGLTPDQEEAVRLEAMQEIALAEGKTPDPKEDPPKKDPDEGDPDAGKKPAEGDGDNKDGENKGDGGEGGGKPKTEEEELTAFTQADESGRKAILEAKKAELDAEADPDRKVALEAVLAKMAGVQEAEAKPEFTDQEIQDLADELGVLEDEAKKILESEVAIAKKYEKDPRKLARAYRHLQSMHSKTAADLKAIKDQIENPPIQAEQLEDVINRGKLVLSGKVVTRQQVIDSYREKNEDIAEDMEDDKVFRLAVREIRQNLADNAKKQIEAVKTEAAKRRETLLAELPEENKKFVPMIKPMLDNMPDNRVIQDTFNLDDIVSWAKGRRYDRDIAAARKEAYEKGKEEAKILGAKANPPAGSGTTKKAAESAKGKGGAGKLTEAEKVEALNMFAGSSYSHMTDEDKYNEYADIIKHRQTVDAKDKK